MPLACPDSFAGIPVFVEAQGRSRSSRAKVSTREIPGGDIVVFNNGGLGVRKRQYTLYVPDDETLTQLEDLCGATADLVYWGGTVRCILEELDASDWWSGGQQRVRASFVVVSQPVVVAPTLPPTAHFSYSAVGLTATLNFNDSTSPDNLIDEINVEWGDGAINTYNVGAPWTVGAIPTRAHTYAIADTYIANVSVERSSVLSADHSDYVTVA